MFHYLHHQTWLPSQEEILWCHQSDELTIQGYCDQKLLVSCQIYFQPTKMIIADISHLDDITMLEMSLIINILY